MIFSNIILPERLTKPHKSLRNILTLNYIYFESISAILFEYNKIPVFNIMQKFFKVSQTLNILKNFQLQDFQQKLNI